MDEADVRAVEAANRALYSAVENADLDAMSALWLDGPADFLMRTQLAATLLADESIKDVNYTIDVVHGVVYLMCVAQD